MLESAGLVMGEQIPIPSNLWETGKAREHDNIRQMTITGSPLVEVVDLFCGGGGFSTGAIQGGAKVVLAIDNWKPALKVHHANHPNVPTAEIELGGSIVETAVFIREHLTPGSHFHLHGSPPCQALSNASNRDSEEGMVLVNWFIDLVRYMKPNSWSMENVIPVAKKIDKHRPGTPYVKLNSADFGVPQTRNRIFAGEGWVAEPTHTKDDWVSVIEALPDLQGELEMTINKNIRQRTVDEPMRSMTSKTPSQTRIVSRRRKKGEEPQSYPPENPAHTITQLPHIAERIVSNTDGCSTSMSRRCQSVDTDISKPAKTIHNNPVSIRHIRLEALGSNAKRQNDRPIDEPSKTICGSGNQVGARIFNHENEVAVKIRSLTLDESKILQGFPDDYKIPYDRKRDAWVIVGNAVCPPVAEAIIRGLKP